MAEIVEGIYASCALCRSWIQRGVAIDHFNVVCPVCADAIVEAWAPKRLEEQAVSEDAEALDDGKESLQEMEEALLDVALECPICGEVFTNRGKYLAHRKAHRKVGEE